MSQQKSLDQILTDRLGKSSCNNVVTTVKYTKKNSIKDNYNTLHKNSLEDVLKSKLSSINDSEKNLEEGLINDPEYINVIDDDSETESTEDTVLITHNKETQITNNNSRYGNNICCKLTMIYIFTLVLFGINNFILFKFTNLEWIGYH